jgi:hypothetical protein
MVTNNKQEKGVLEYRSVLFDTPGISIYEEWNGNYGFELHNKVFTNDVVEAVSYLMRFDKYDNESFWNLEISRTNLMYVNPINSLYWLSGGDDFWLHNERGLLWCEVYPLLLDKFSDVILNSVIGRKLGDVRDNIVKHLNLDEFYEFILYKCESI